MIDAFDSLWEQSRPAFEQERTWRRARTLAFSTLVGLGRHTITGLLTTSAQQGVDWSAAYRLFEQERFDAGALFAPARRSVCSRLGEKEPLVVLMDDTLVRKRGKKVHGTGWKKDRPLIVSADGSFTNKTVFRALPPNTTVIGRIRKDARFLQP
jgi:hypothetical protein